MRIVFRTDASVEISSGHVMRCLALASVMKKEVGADIQFISRKYKGNLNDLIRKRGFKVMELLNPFCNNVVNKSIPRINQKEINLLGISQEQDAKETINAIGGENFDWIIIDHYSLDDKWKLFLRPYTKYIFEIDDLYRKFKYSDVVLNQAPIEISKKHYNNNSKTKLLLGPEYALIDEKYINVRKNLKSRDGIINRILVFYGGVDKTNETTKALNAIKKLKLTEIFTDVVIGESNVHRDVIINNVNGMNKTKLYIQLPTLANLVGDADLALGSGGGTTWERIYLGLPSIVTTVSNNQVSIPYLDEHGFLFWVGDAKEVSQKIIENKISELIMNPYILMNQSLRCMDFIDGKGIKRIIKTLKQFQG